MPNVPQRRSQRARQVIRVRDVTERMIQRTMQRVLADGWKRLQPDVARIERVEKAWTASDQAAFWRDWQASLQSAIEDTIRAAARDVTDTEASYFTQRGYNLSTFTMSEVYNTYIEQTGSLITNIGEDTRTSVAQAITDWMETDAPQSDLIDTLQTWFSEARAETVAATEATALSAAGTVAVMRRTNTMEWFWMTANDGIVCTKGRNPCAPKHGVRYRLDEDPTPPGHVRCRCVMAPDV